MSFNSELADLMIGTEQFLLLPFILHPLPFNFHSLRNSPTIIGIQ